MNYKDGYKYCLRESLEHFTFSDLKERLYEEKMSREDMLRLAAFKELSLDEYFQREWFTENDTLNNKIAVFFTKQFKWREEEDYREEMENALILYHQESIYADLGTAADRMIFEMENE